MIALTRTRALARPDVPLLLSLVFYGGLCVMQLNDFVLWWSSNFVIGCIGMPFLLTTVTARPISGRYGFAAVAFSLLYFFFPVRTCLYVALVCALLFLYESVRGRTSLLPFITLLLMSPVAQYFADAFSFTLRLQLTRLAGSTLRLVGRDAVVSGNLITFNGTDFSVDPACMGLHMLLSSLLCCLLIIAVQQKRQGRELSTGWVMIVCTGAIVLNIFSNLMRILLLVQFRIMPGTAMHELIGICCLLLYVILPALIGLQWLVRRAGRPPAAPAAVATTMRMGWLPAHVLIALAMTGGIFYAGSHPTKLVTLPAVPGYSSSHYDAGVAKLENERSLIYLKDLKGFYCSEHHPMLCWTGSGFLFQQVAESNISGVRVISGTLQKGKEKLFTAWWYSNGLSRTSSGLGWRWDALRNGSRYCIVNVTAADEATLATEIARVVSSRQLNAWIAQGNK